MINIENELITQLNDFEDNGSGLIAIPMTDEEWQEMTLEKPHYSDDEEIQKKFEYAVKITGMGRVLCAMCKEFNESLKWFIEEYFEDKQLWNDYMEDKCYK